MAKPKKGKMIEKQGFFGNRKIIYYEEETKDISVVDDYLRHRD